MFAIPQVNQDTNNFSIYDYISFATFLSAVRRVYALLLCLMPGKESAFPFIGMHKQYIDKCQAS